MNRRDLWEADSGGQEAFLCDSPEERALAKIAKESSERAAETIREIFQRPASSAAEKAKRE